MSMEEAFLCCTVNLEWLNKQGCVQRKLSHKNGKLRLIRNDVRNILIEISAEKVAPVKLNVQGISVFKKFMNEGKASIQFKEDNARMYLSNAPPGQLLNFLRILFVKMTGGKTPQKNVSTSLRTQLLSNNRQKFDEISPVTNVELDKAKAKVSKATETTPSPLSNKKRKLECNGKPAAAKKLYTSSPAPNQSLNFEQKEVLDACLTGQNVFFTGSAGTGKSYLLKIIIGALPPDVTTATASTGVAACHIGGITLHQFAGIGSGNASVEESIKMASRTPTLSIWRKCRHLIIDEISMVDAEYFQKIEEVARKIRRNDKPFGGIQLILCGDFLQLPPVTKPIPGQTKVSPKFCFQAKAWENCRLATFELKQVHRQDDPKFIDILNKIRIGRVDQEVSDTLTLTAKQKIEVEGILATRLCSVNKDADLINESKLKALEGESKIFQAEDSVPGSTKQLDQQTVVPSRLELKIGAQVMLLKNINVAWGLVNGARGVVKEFRNGFPVVHFRNKEYVAIHEKWHIKTANGGTLTRKQVPLKLAWAFSIHKSQGLTLDCVEMALGGVFEAGQAYVALSRAQSLKTLRVLDFRSTQVWANPDVLTFYRTLENTRIVPLGLINKSNVNKDLTRKKGNRISKSKFLDKPLVTIS